MKTAPRTALLALAMASAALAPSRSAAQTLDAASLERLMTSSGGTAEIELHTKTGMARFVSFAPGSLGLGIAPSAGVEQKAEAFFTEHGDLFGIRSSTDELILSEDRVDALGERHLFYEQEYEGLPVFGGWLRAHFDDQEQLQAVNGNFLPNLGLDPIARRSAEEAGRTALDRVGGSDVEILSSRLAIFRTALLRAGAGRDYLVWQVDVGNGAGVRELVFVDAHTGKVVDQITGIHESINRRIHQNGFGQVIWQEGDSRPYVGTPPDSDTDGQINRLIDTAGEVYDLFHNLSNGTFVSWDGTDGRMDSVYEDEDIECPNAAWNGVSTNFCSGTTGDDTVAHEWTHAYSQSTHGLIYQDQAGALSESFSDIFGEVVDLLNGTGSDFPDDARTPNQCSIRGGRVPPRCTVNSPDDVGDLAASGATFNPAAPLVVQADVELVNDDEATGEEGSLTDGCESFVDFTTGSLALLDRGNCDFVVKVANAQEAGAVGVLIANHSPGLLLMGGDTGQITIPSILIGQLDGEDLKARLATSTVNATIEFASASDPSYRWLSSEDDPAFGGAIRDLRNPSCFDDPEKVSDPRYACSEDDNGGVHTNSGIPNHGFSLLVDGGTFNGQTIEPLGLTKAAHIYWRSMSVYQGPTTSFSDHADAVDRSCRDLIGTDLTDLENGLPSGQILTETDCEQVDKTAVALELGDFPTQCVFETILDPDAPELTCNETVFLEEFETSANSWTVSNEGVYADYAPRDWELTAEVPQGGTGSAFFAIDSLDIGDCQPGSDDQSGVMHLDSPEITLPLRPGSAILTFDHWIATEEDYDGGNVKISVNGSGFTRIIAAEDYTFNPYNGFLETGNAVNANTSPMAGEPAFHGADQGTLSGSWGQSRIDLRNYAGEGDRIRIRFDLGVDGCNGNHGWYVDNVRMCSAPVYWFTPSN
jgi:Zn-dependent metalloprotease